MHLYILANNKLSKKQQWVQAAHAVAQHLVDFPNTPWRNYSLVMLQCPDIEEWEELFYFKGIEYSKFTEPYFNNMTTALSSLHIGDLVGNLELI